MMGSTFEERWPATSWFAHDPAEWSRFNQPFGELKPTELKPSEAAEYAMQHQFEQWGAEPEYAKRRAALASGALGFTPVGMGLAAADIPHDVKEGNYLGAGLDVLGAAPLAGAAVRQLRQPAKAALGATAALGGLMAQTDEAEAGNYKPTFLQQLRSATSPYKPNPATGEQWPDWMLRHRIASTKLNEPLSSIAVEATHNPPPPTAQVTPADLANRWLLPLPHDPTSLGTTISSVGGNRLSAPFTTLGGGQYMDKYTGFANMPNAATLQAARIKNLSEVFNTDVYGVGLKMGPQSADFSSHTWAPMARMFEEAPMSGKATKRLNADIRSDLRNSPDRADDWPKFPGVDIGAKQLEEHLRNAPDLYRKTIINTVEKARGTPGVPDVVGIRYATTRPELLDAPTHSSGLNLVRLTGETRPSEHPDYRTHLVGTGTPVGLGEQFPREVFWQDMVERFAKQGKPPADWARVLTQTPQAGEHYGQLASPRWVDSVSQFQADRRVMGETAALDKFLADRFGWGPGNWPDIIPRKPPTKREK